MTVPGRLLDAIARMESNGLAIRQGFRRGPLAVREHAAIGGELQAVANQRQQRIALRAQNGASQRCDREASMPSSCATS